MAIGRHDEWVEIQENGLRGVMGGGGKEGKGLWGLALSGVDRVINSGERVRGGRHKRGDERTRITAHVLYTAHKLSTYKLE